MKSLAILFFLILSISLVFAIQITEVELNGIEGEEWVEIYNEGSQEINISEWEFWDGLSSSKKIHTVPFNTTLNPGEFYVFDCSSKLNNVGDFVILYDFNLTKMDETPQLKDSTKSSETWNFCDQEWIFINSSKNLSNACPLEEPPTEDFINFTQSSFENEISEEIEDNDAEELVLEETKIDFKDKGNLSKDSPEEKLVLTSNALENSDTKPLNKKISSILYIVSFCLLLALLIALRFIKPKRKNEFRENT